MTGTEIDIFISIAGTIGGALGAKRAGSEMWRGGLVFILSFLGSVAILYAAGVRNLLLFSLAALVIAGLAGGALKLAPRQIAAIVVASLLLMACAGGVVAVFFV